MDSSTIATSTTAASLPAAADAKLLFDEPPGTLWQRAYAGAIGISTTRTVRASVARAGYKSPPIKTHTYLFVDSIPTSSGMPTMSPTRPAGGWGSWIWTTSMPRPRAMCSTLMTLA